MIRGLRLTRADYDWRLARARFQDHRQRDLDLAEGFRAGRADRPQEAGSPFRAAPSATSQISPRRGSREAIGECRLPFALLRRGIAAAGIGP